MKLKMLPFVAVIGLCAGLLVTGNAGAGTELIDACRSRMSTGLVDLDPAVPATGRITKRWNLRVNVDLSNGNLS